MFSIWLRHTPGYVADTWSRFGKRTYPTMTDAVADIADAPSAVWMHVVDVRITPTQAGIPS